MKLNIEPIAKKAIDEAKKQKAIVITCINGFQTESEALFLRDMLWYAKNKGVEVRFMPLVKSQQKNKL